jgi:hypothetical protein
MSTHYEIILTDKTSRFLVCYAGGSPSRQNLIKCVRSRIANIERKLNQHIESFFVEPRAQDGLTIGAWNIRYSGRTEREARAAELEYCA